MMSTTSASARRTDCTGSSTKPRWTSTQLFSNDSRSAGSNSRISSERCRFSRSVSAASAGAAFSDGAFVLGAVVLLEVFGPTPLGQHGPDGCERDHQQDDNDDEDGYCAVHGHLSGVMNDTL